MSSETHRMTPTLTVLAGRRRSVATLLLLHDLWEQAATRSAFKGVVCRSEWNLVRIREWSRRFGSGLVRKIAGELRLGGQHTEAEQQLLWDRYRAAGLTERSIAIFCQRRGIPFRIVSDLESSQSLTTICSLGTNTAIYSGAGILRKPLLDCFEHGVLNLHCGPLPAVRGMNGVEWSLYLGLPAAVTLHHIDTGIDTGPILAERLVPIESGDTLSHVRGRAILTGLDLLRDSLPQLDRMKPRPNPTAEGRQYFQMTERLQAIAARRMSQSTTMQHPATRAA